MSTIDLGGLSPAEKRALLAERLKDRKRRQRPLRRFPASFAQQRLWFLDQLTPGNAAYNIPGALRLHGAIDLDLWRRACAEIVRRHESLRTTFEEVDGEPVQVIAETGEPEFDVVECGHLAGPQGDVEITRLARAEFARPFDLRTGPLLRVKFLRLRSDEHVLLLTMHHIVGDLWSTSVAFAELVALYGAFQAGGEAANALPDDLPVQYADYAVWQRERLDGGALADDLAYWTQALQGAPAALELPTDRPRPAVQGVHGASRPFRLSAHTMDAVRELSRGAGATPFMTLLAAFGVLLHRYSRTDDIVVGVPVAGRVRPEVERLIGLFVNMLALRTDLSGEPTFRELVARVRRTCLDGFAHQELPFERLVEELHPRRDLSRSPVFQVSFIFQNIPLPEFDGIGLRVEPVEIETVTSRFDLTLEVFDRPDGLRGWLEYNSDLFDAATVQRLSEQLELLVTRLVADPDEPVARVAMLTAEQERRLRLEWNDTRRDWPQPLLTHERFARQAALTPDAEAVRADDGVLTYGELDRRANRLAHRLERLGVGRDTLVGICLERSTEMVVAMLAVLKAGGAYVPLDLTFPPDRLTFMVADSRLPVLVTRRRVLAEANELGTAEAQVLCLDEAGLDAESDGPLHAPVAAADLAYVIYTSGSTGRPKGVQIPHGALANFLRAMKERPGIEPDDVLLAVTTLSFDISMLEILLPLVEGARVVLASREVAADGERLAAVLATSGATMMQATPSTWRMLLDAGWPGRGGMRVLTGGEALPAELAERLLATGVTLWNMYGPTETTIWSSVARIDAGPVRLGEPIANTELHVLDDLDRPAPLGVPGELCIGGAGLARGYLGRPELTAEKFVAHPFETGLGDRLYRTGDLVRRLSDGSLEFLGRLDHQVKLRGFRIELGEIESVLARQPAVGQAAVVIRQDVPGDQRLVAYLVPTADALDRPAVIAGLRAALGATLPDYMIPSVFVFLDALPLTPNNKIDRGALPVPDGGLTDLGAHYVAPRDEAEARLCTLFAGVLGLPEVGIDNDFFELGGHSLLATRLIAQIRTAFAAELQVRTLFQHPTVARLAPCLRRAGTARPALRPAVRPDPLPLSFAQRRLWFLHHLEGPSATYNIPIALRLTGPLDVDAMRAALADVVARHETLRTVFPDTDGVPYQRILRPEQSRPRLEVTAVGAADLAAAVGAAARYAFDLAVEAPIHARLFALGPDEHVLVLVVHHIAADAWSLAPLGRDLAVAYAARREGRAVAQPPLSVQYADYTLWQHALLGDQDGPGSRWADQLGYWRKALEGLPERIALPTDRPHPPQASLRGRTLAFEWDTDLHAGLTSLARSGGSSTFMVVNAALAALLGRMGAGEDIPIGAAIAGRTDSAAEDLVGFFVNTLVLRVDLADAPTFRDLLARVRETGLDAYANQDVPFEYLVDAVNPTRSLAHHPLVQVMIAWQNTPDAALDLPGLRVQPMPAATGTARMDLAFTLAERPRDGGIDGTVEFNTDVFDPTTVESLLDRLRRLLRAVTADPDLPITGIDLLGRDERHRLLTGWNDTAQPLPRATLRELFEAQVARDPRGVAVRGADTTLTYARLDAVAGRLAGRLAELGVRAGSRVAILQGRSVDLVVSVLAVVKAGGVYVPLDDRYPPSRIQMIMAETRASVLLVDGSARRPPVDEDVHVITVDGLADESVDEGAVAAAGPPATDPHPHPHPDPDPASDPDPDPDPDQPVYVMYTSGSTGTPKGVVVTHRNVVALAQDRRWRQGDHTRVLMHSPSAFDASTYELWVPLLSGGRVVVAPPGALDPETLEQTVREHGVTAAFLTTALFNLVVEQRPRALAGLRQVWTGGEAVSPAAFERALRTCPDTRFVHVYGPTETTTFATCHPTRGPVHSTVPIGRPMDNTRVYVLDGGLKPVPPGVPGELFIGGAGVAQGYLERPELTRERFLADPYGEAGARLYRTGDLVRWTSEGVLEFVGRTDDQVKIRGFRIEPGEIEAVLAAHPAVGQAAVVVREDRPGDRRLVGYVVPAESVRGGVDPAELRDFLAERLPQYMVPAAVVLLGELPLTPNEKLDRSALPAPDYGTATTESRDPATPAEELLCAAFAEILGLARVGVHDDFFELGGNSLLATRLVSQLRSVHGIHLPIRDLFDNPTVARLAARTEAREVHAPAMEAIAPLADRGGAVPLSFAQEWLCANHPVAADDPYHNVLTAVTLRGELDDRALRRSLDDIVLRHEALRIRVVDGPAGWYQTARPTGGWPLTVVDLRDHDETARFEELRRLIGTEERRAFRIGDEPLLRGALVRLTADESVLIFVIHHLVTDNWAYGVLVRELCELYEAHTLGRPSRLPEIEVQYLDYAAWQRRRLADGALDDHIGYWRRRLAGLPAPLDLTVPDHQRIAATSGHTRGFVLDAAAARGLAELAQAEEASLFMVLMAAFHLLLAAYADSDDIVVAFPVAGRDRPETEQMMGFFVNHLLVRTDLSGAPTFRDLVRQVRDETLGGYGHQDVPVWSLDEVTDAARSPFAIAFNLLNAEVPALDLHGLAASPLELNIGDDYVFSEVIITMEPSAVDLTLIMREDGDELRGMWLYSSEHIDPVAMAVLMDRWAPLLGLVVDDPEREVGELRDLLRATVLTAHRDRPGAPAGETV
ncbi:amino acid adenylation domain-containing protein [Frankia sp. ArI3]|uniref:amino acid adenylation domain-containing protein n=1 Tax=Frankia sp. ArI3 TaxID=1858 RepID=UPI001C6FCB5B|nr:non-ribosomal peptide synthetase [Frankia sp. ArI3]